MEYTCLKGIQVANSNFKFKKKTFIDTKAKKLTKILSRHTPSKKVSRYLASTRTIYL